MSADIKIDAFKLFWLKCQQKKDLWSVEVCVKPTIVSELNSPDLIDMQSMDNELEQDLVSQDHLTQFHVLGAFKSKLASEAAFEVVDSFFLIGALMISQSYL